MNIKPAILPHNFEEITEKLTRLEGFSNKVQIDLCDGVFGREKTWLPDGTENLPEGFGYEFDVMLNDWKVYVPRCVSLGAKSIIAHVDMFSEDDVLNFIKMIESSGISIGVSVSNDKSADFHADMVRKFSEKYNNIFVQVMGIFKIGEQGQIFDEEVPERIKKLKQYFGDIPLQVDGAMTPETGQRVVGCGASTLVVGSYIFGSEDISIAIKNMEALEPHG